LRSDNGPEFVARDLGQWLANTGAKTLHIEPRFPVGERLLRELQLEATQRVPERPNLLLDEGDQGAGRALANPLQHHQAALFAGLSATGTAGLGGIKLGPWGGGNRYAHPTSHAPNGNYLTSEIVALH
jgi:hypothetical protein